jgi:nitrogen fixation NifU-like protein
MNGDLQDLYQELILDHNKKPRNCRVIEDASSQADGHNPLCGDRLTVYVTVGGGIVMDVSFEGSGCAISTASASLMTETIKGRSLEAARRVFSQFHGMLTAGQSMPEDDGLAKLQVFSGVGRFPARVKCATLAWHTLASALNDDHAIVSTE